MGPERSDTETSTRIIRATRRALIEHGYDGLSMAKVADEFDGSQSLIHYHFDSREGLLAALLERERDLYADLFEEFPTAPDARLERTMDEFIRNFDEWAEESGMAVRIVELYAAATNSERIRTALRELYALFRAEFEQTIADGIEAGVFEQVDPGHVARLLLAGVDSAMNRWVMDESDEIPLIADALEAYVLTEVRR